MNRVRRFATGSRDPLTPYWGKDHLMPSLPRQSISGTKNIHGLLSIQDAPTSTLPANRPLTLPPWNPVLAKTGYSLAILILPSSIVWTVFGARSETTIASPESFREAIKPWMTDRQRPSQAAFFLIFPKANIAGFKNPGANRWCKTPKK